MFLPAEAEDADAVEYGKDIKKRTPNIIFGVLFFISFLIYALVGSTFIILH